MTMQNAPHPDDERLAAYAGGDRDAVADRALVEHLTACDRCRPIVDELTVLHRALAALPDLAPSRPLRLIPPVAAPAARRVGPREWLRRLAAPAMATGAGLVLIGAVGVSGIVAEFTTNQAGSKAMQETNATDAAGAPAASGAPIVAPGSVTDGSGYSSRSDEPRSQTDGAAASQPPASKAPAPQEGTDRGLDDVTGGPSAEQPWLTLLIAGFALFGISAVVRFSLAPRAG